MRGASHCPAPTLLPAGVLRGRPVSVGSATVTGDLAGEGARAPLPQLRGNPMDEAVRTME